ncbi:MAG: Ig-like domain-containing protein [Acidimicrobiales bacterium]
MSTVKAALAGLAIVAVASCGGDPGVDEAEDAPAEQVATPVAPDELALSGAELEVAGDEGALVRAGETVSMLHLVYNDAPTARSLGFRVETELDDPEIELSVRSVRVGSGEVLTFESSVDVPAKADVGDVLEYEVIVVNVDDINERGSSTVKLLVVEAEGDRPVAGPDAGTTTTNERIISYVVRDDSDADGDLDLQSLRVIAGGFLAAELTSNSTGTITYVPFANVIGSDVVLYEICDSEERCATAPLSIQIDE